MVLASKHKAENNNFADKNGPFSPSPVPNPFSGWLPDRLASQ
jgi:hypothetical protein